MKNAKEILGGSVDELRARLREGSSLDPSVLEGHAYRGLALGLPEIIERLTWTTFQKTFFRDPETGRLRGWNVRLHQDGIDAPSRPKLRDGRPLCFGRYEVLAAGALPTPPGYEHGLLIDYDRGANARFDPIRLAKDPIVSLDGGEGRFVLGMSYLLVRNRCVETPSFFLLEREHPIRYVDAG
jgi:hypothetical protein